MIITKRTLYYAEEVTDSYVVTKETVYRVLGIPVFTNSSEYSPEKMAELDVTEATARVQVHRADEEIGYEEEEDKA